MKISYDPETDALYIRLLEGHHECRNVRLNDEVALNIGPNETLVGIEILDAGSLGKTACRRCPWKTSAWRRPDG